MYTHPICPIQVDISVADLTYIHEQNSQGCVFRLLSYKEDFATVQVYVPNITETLEDRTNIVCSKPILKCVYLNRSSVYKRMFVPSRSIVFAKRPLGSIRIEEIKWLLELM